MRQEYKQIEAFINRKTELAELHERVQREPANILFVYGPKSSGKTTLLFKFINELRKNKKQKYEVMHHNLREVSISRYENFLRTFFYVEEQNQSAQKTSVGISLGIITITQETERQMKQFNLDPFKVMKDEFEKLNQKGIRPVIIIDELQALDDIYMNDQKLLIRELFNFFVAMTKESHLCHVIIASSDGYFIEKIYNDSKLHKTSEFMSVDYLTQEDTMYWLHNLEKESAIKAYTLTENQIDAMWDFFGGSCWEISNFLDTIRGGAEDKQIPQKHFDEQLKRKIIQMRSYFEDYIKHEKHIHLFIAMNQIVQESKKFKALALHVLVPTNYTLAELTEQLGVLVQKNFLHYIPVTAEYCLQGTSMEIGLSEFVKMIQQM